MTEMIDLRTQLLLGRDKQAKSLVASAAIRQLDQIANANGDRGCPFAAGTSPLTNFITDDVDADVVMMFTDMVFDIGPKVGPAAARTDFVDAAVKWQARSDQTDAALKGLGVVALESQFSGTYWWADSVTDVPNLTTSKRPLFVLWRTNGVRRSGQFINTYLKQLAPPVAGPVPRATDKQDAAVKSKADAGTVPALVSPRPIGASFTLLPYLSNDWQVRFDRVTRTSEYLRNGKGHSGRPPLTTYDFVDIKKIPQTAVIDPSQCFSWRAGAGIEFRIACASSSSEVKSNFATLRQFDVQAAHLWWELESLPGLAREFKPANADSAALNMTFLTACAGTQPNCSAGTLARQSPALNSKAGYPFQADEVKSFLAITMFPLSPLVTDSKWTSREIIWTESFRAESSSAASVLSAAAQPWNAQREPCERGAKATPEQCDDYAARTVGFDALVASLAGRLNPAKKLAETLNCTDTGDTRCRVSFFAARTSLSERGSKK